MIYFLKLGYKLTTSGELRTKIQLTFELYDTDKDGYLDKEEVNTIVKALMTMLGNEDDSQEAMAEIQFLLLDRNNDGKISMDEFVDGLTMNNNLRLLMSPFV
jgi:Ca2+-binding EF-hand superfamily protein